MIRSNSFEPIYSDIHIHTSEQPNKIKSGIKYDLQSLIKNVDNISKGYKKILNNNMKGIIKNIQIDRDNECNWFEIEVFSSILLSRCVFSDIQILSHYDQKTLIRFFVRNFKDTNDDENNYEHIIPFNLSYAVSIHKAQGLEYDSVKVVITSSVEDRITKNIFYTAITRAKKHLQIFWSNESQAKIFDNFKKRINTKDISILKGKIQ